MGADVYSIESSAYIDTQVMFNVNGRLFVKIENSKGPRQLPCGIPHFTCFTLEKRP